jgi:hypothetical protein
MNILFSPGAPLIRGFNPQDDFTYTVTQNPGAAVTTTTSGQLYDANVTHYYNSGIPNNFDISIQQSLTNPIKSMSITPVPPTLATIDLQGHVTYSGQETAVFEIQSGGITRRYFQWMQSIGFVDNYYTTSYLPNSLGEHISSSTDALLIGKVAQGQTSGLAWNLSYPQSGGSQNRLLNCNYDVNAIAADINPNFFGKDILNISAVGIVNTHGSTVFNEHPGLLITPRHIFGANHYQTGNGVIGSKIVFMANDGSFQVRTLIDKWSDSGRDHWLGYLDAPVTGIPVLKIMPTGWRTYFKSLDTSLGPYKGIVAVISKTTHLANGTGNSDRWAVNDYQQYIINFSGSVWDFTSCDTSTSSPRSTWNSLISGGDSGGGVFLLVQNSLVLISAYVFPGGGYSIEQNSSRLESQMLLLSTNNGGSTAAVDNTFTRADLSSFTTY